MVALPNKFYRGVVHSPKNPKHPNFRFLIVDTVYEKQDENGQWYVDSFHSYEDFLLHNPDKGDSFYGIYGSYWIDIPRNTLKIGETFDLKEAILIAESIMGNTITETTE
jgi:hypothetical protein